MFFNNRLYLFWQVGKYVFQKQNFCENAVYKYSTLCSYHYGMSDAFSVENVKMMRMFYLCFPFLFPTMKKLKWEHYLELLKVSDTKKRYFYFKTAIFCNGSILDLRDMIYNDFYDKI